MTTIRATAELQRPAGEARRSGDLPGPTAPGWVQAAQFLARPDLFLERNWRRHGDIFRARIQGFGTGRHVVLAHPDMAETVFKASSKSLQLGKVAEKFLAPVMGPNSLLVLDGDEHLAHRRLMLPPFHGQRMLAYADIMSEAADSSMQHWPVDTPFALRPRMLDITLDVIMRAVFGIERGERYVELRDALLALIAKNNVGNVLALTFPLLRRNVGPLRSWAAFQAAKERVDALVYAELRDRRRASDLARREDILSMLILARRKDGTGFTDDELHDELLTMLLAGHETTGTALAWTVDLLLHHPESLARLRAELATGDESFLEAVLNESMRLRPVVATSQRVLTEPMEIGGHTLEPRTTVLTAIWLIHRRPDLYPDPFAFRPERFLDTRPGTYTWVPFGGGVRRCIGSNFAPMEMKVVLKKILSEVKLEPARAALERPVNRVVLLAPRHGTMVIRRR